MATSVVNTGYQENYFSNKTVPNATTTVVASLTLTRGVWVVWARAEWGTSFTTGYQTYLYAGALSSSDCYRGLTGASGGGAPHVNIFNITAASQTVYYSIYQASGASRDTRYTRMKAVRIA